MMLQPFLPGYEPNEADMIAMALQMPLPVKIERSILLLREFEKKALSMSDDGYFLAFSGGKDSQVIQELADMAGVKYRSVYSVTTIDPPELCRFIRREYPDTEWSRPEMSLMKMLVEKVEKVRHMSDTFRRNL